MDLRADCGDSDRERRVFAGRQSLEMDGVGISESGPFNERFYTTKRKERNGYLATIARDVG
jgi:hypothetical protein